jgi:spermidine synthase
MERRDEAIEILRQGRAVKPSDAILANNLAWRLATSPQPALRNGEEAVQLAELANELFSGKHVSLLNTLAAAYAAAGRFPDAIATAQEALALARQDRDEATVARTLDFLERFQRGEAIVDRKPGDDG